MTPAERATALVLVILVAVISFALGATVAFLLAVREPRKRPRHLELSASKRHRHRLPPRHEWRLWTVSTVARFLRYEDGGPKAAVTFGLLFLAFSVLIGANQ